MELAGSRWARDVLEEGAVGAGALVLADARLEVRVAARVEQHRLGGHVDAAHHAARLDPVLDHRRPTDLDLVVSRGGKPAGRRAVEGEAAVREREVERSARHTSPRGTHSRDPQLPHGEHACVDALHRVGEGAAVPWRTGEVRARAPVQELRAAGDDRGVAAVARAPDGWRTSNLQWAASEPVYAWLQAHHAARVDNGVQRVARGDGAGAGRLRRRREPDHPARRPRCGGVPPLYPLVRRVRVLLAEFRKFERELSSIPRYANLKQQRVPLSNCIV